ncbi:hypothetical protein [Mycobacterium sp. NAZ190054]|uniref:hypothetical protein n=1 Tax=Mycobacterium sp. NAZ190054 TaxID=1747766 RepID=UPI000AB3D1B7|nr:hypothetical protein [Mycobacterium sp. NAZ190054]
MTQPGRLQPPVVVGALLAVVVLVAATLLISRGDSDQPPSPAAPAAPPSPTVDADKIASARDDDPVSIITEDPTCPEWEPITAALNTELGNGWHRRDPALPQTEWTPDQRRQYDAVADAMREAADKTVPLAKQTPHRVMRELYEQAIAYWRAYAESVDNYRPVADELARTAISAAEAVQSICAAIDFGAAADRGPLVLPGPPPVPEGPLSDPARPPRFIAGPSAFCNEWTSMVLEYADQTREWRDRHDPNLPGVHRPPELRELGDDVAAIMQQNADQAQLLGLMSGNLTAADFAALSSHYRRAFALALPTYGLPDTHLDAAATRLQSLTDHACRAVRR